MIQFITKLLIYRQIYNFIKERIVGISFTAIMIFLIIYIHSEYLNYVEFKEKTSANYIGLSFIIKNSLILIVTLSYFYFYRFLSKAKKKIENNEINFVQNKDNGSERIDDLDYFLNDDEINRDK
ncbi:hypothetical protein IDH01_05675 [Pelagibacterales bacterium SAG-MED08]|jgi:hypothetical protein|nr:hypothetical protein [Pelagibacterales bacterium SAG-MED08]|tara:strand:- start:161 stop:532 length:372 start_codon:yes stop_codon:yes gene_type:complete